MDCPNGLRFSPDLQQQIKSRFYYVDEDKFIGSRLYFDNAGGSFRLKSVVDAFRDLDSIPDCPERIHRMALYLQEVQTKGEDDIRMMLNAEGGSILTSLTASQVIFEMVRVAAENVAGTNMVTTVLEHPSSYDAMEFYAKRTGRELRVAHANPITGGVDADEICRHIDENTAVLSVMYASNITGAIFDLEEIVKKARAIKPDLYILTDAVQHMPHGLIDLQKTPLDGINFAPYKFFGYRGSGIAWVSDRMATLPHHKLAGKPAQEWELGSPAAAQFAAVSAIADYVCWLGGQFLDSADRRSLFAEGMIRIQLHERALLHRMLEGTPDQPGLRHIAGVRVFLDCPDLTTRDLILAMGFDNIDCTHAVREYEARNVIVYDRLASSIYSSRMLNAFGMDGAVRISPLHCHSFADIDRFLAITAELAAMAE